VFECAREEIYRGFGDDRNGEKMEDSCGKIFEHICVKDASSKKCMQICANSPCTTFDFVEFQRLGCLESEFSRRQKEYISEWDQGIMANNCDGNLLEGDDSRPIQWAINAKMRCETNARCAGVLKSLNSGSDAYFLLIGPNLQNDSSISSL
jgi:hypothetical protein